MNKELLKNAKPILFNTETVKAIKDGRKTQTRRVINVDIKAMLVSDDCMKISPSEPNGFAVFDVNGNIDTVKCKYNVGDVLYVKEDWKVGGWNETSFAIDHSCPPYDKSWHTPNIGQYNDLLSSVIEELVDMNYPVREDGHYIWEKYNSPLELMDKKTMPKWMARIFLRVTDVMVERLHDMDYEEFKAEGVTPRLDYRDCCPETGMPCSDYNTPWVKLWNSISKDGYKWEDNPWVFVYEFEAIAS